MTEKKLREAEKSPLTISFNAKEECLLKKKILSLDAMQRQAADSLTLDQKILYNQFTLKLRRSELSHARLIGNTEIIKHLTRAMFSSLNTTLNDGAEEAVRTIVQSGKLPRAASAPCRPTSRMSDRERSHKSNAMFRSSMQQSKEVDFPTKKRGCSAPKRFYSAPARRQVQFLDKQNSSLALSTYPGSLAQKQERVFKHLPSTETSNTNEHGWPESNTNFMKKRPKSTSFLMDKVGTQLTGSLVTPNKVTGYSEDHFDSKVKVFLEKVKSMQQLDSTLRDYYSQRLLDGPGKREMFALRSIDEEERHHWLPVGEEPRHRSVTIKKLDTNFTKRDVPLDMLFMEQYNAVVTKENYLVRNWLNNNPYSSK